MNNEMNEKLDEQFNKILNEDANKHIEDNLINKCKKSLNMIQYISLGFYLPNLIFYSINSLNNLAFKTIMQVIIFYFMFQYIKKGHQNIAIIPLIGSLASFIYVSEFFKLAKYNNIFTLVGVFSLCMAIFGTVSMLYILFDSNIKKYFEYMKNK